jgi:hypothetical protein
MSRLKSASPTITMLVGDKSSNRRIKRRALEDFTGAASNLRLWYRAPTSQGRLRLRTVPLGPK